MGREKFASPGQNIIFLKELIVHRFILKLILITIKKTMLTQNKEQEATKYGIHYLFVCEIFIKKIYILHQRELIL